MARTTLPGWVLPIILFRTWILLPSWHMNVQERPIVGFGSTKDFVQGSIGTYFDGQICSFSAYVGLQPLYSKMINICSDTYAVYRKVGLGQYVLYSAVRRRLRTSKKSNSKLTTQHMHEMAVA
jgi:hypothetical protein